MDNDYDSAGYSDFVTDLGFFVLIMIACLALGVVIYLVLLE